MIEIYGLYGCMNILRKIAQKVRHFPGLERAELIWHVLRPAYHRLLNASGAGVEVNVGNCATVSMPAEFAGGYWEQYEPETVDAFLKWIRGHPGGLVLDVGSAVGIFSAVALFADSSTEVVAFDSDLASLAATRRMCRYAPGERLRVVQGLLCAEPSVSMILSEASATTDAALAASRPADLVNANRYICLSDADAASIRRLRLDDLFPPDVAARRAMLLKCDVEGAELLVLRGARALIEREHPHLLLSVHPPALPSYGHSREEVQSLVTELGYRIRVIAIDHEEHWWCERSA